MLLKQLEYFVKVVECRNFTEAAEQCYVSESAISQQVQALEKELGVQLLERKGRFFTVTPAGDYLCWKGKEVLNDVDRLRHETVRIGTKDQASLRLGYASGFISGEFAAAVAEFSGKYPEVSLQITAGTHEELQHLLVEGQIDLALNDQRRALDHDLVTLALPLSDMYAEISRANPLSSRKQLSIEDLQQLPCILVAPPAQHHAEQEYYRHGLGFGSEYLFAMSLGEARLMAAANRGFLPADSVGTLPPAQEGIIRIPICSGGRPLQRQYCLFWNRQNSGFYAEEFIAIFRRRSRRQGAAGAEGQISSGDA